jgi:peroxiredoxin Q/BCP
VSFDTEKENRAFAEKYDFDFPLLCDTERKIGLAYGACDREDAPSARRISYLIGPDGRILRAFPKVSAATHPEEVLRALET